jgi:hypothetical protein|tara:strand:- start:5699 stop:6379 length:681 start_codon:yes stop_codon:yes gene_type:complete
MKKMTEIDYKLNKCYKSRNINLTYNPKFKLNAFCINLKDRKQNMDFIHSEWNEYLNITRFIALPSATESHVQLLKNIFQNKDNIKFPIVIMEDDVYRKNNFTKYWNELLDLTECDYVAFDAFFLAFKNNQNNVPPNFVSLKEHRMMGFTVYYKNFFDRFRTIEHLDRAINRGVIDMSFTYNPSFINYTPKEQVCCQIVSKFSTTANKETHGWGNFYRIAQEKLKTI